MANKRHFIIWKNNNKTGDYPVYLCNKAIIPKNGESCIDSLVNIDKVTCKNCLNKLTEINED
jgi:hypothetical protein